MLNSKPVHLEEEKNNFLCRFYGNVRDHTTSLQQLMLALHADVDEIISSNYREKFGFAWIILLTIWVLSGSFVFAVNWGHWPYFFISLSQLVGLYTGKSHVIYYPQGWPQIWQQPIIITLCNERNVKSFTMKKPALTSLFTSINVNCVLHSVHILRSELRSFHSWY